MTLRETRPYHSDELTELQQAGTEQEQEQSQASIHTAQGSSMQLYTQVLDGMAQGACLFDEKGIIQYTNPSHDAMFGYERGELTGLSFSVESGYTSGEEAEKKAEIDSALNAGGSWSGEWSSKKKDGAGFSTFAHFSRAALAGHTYTLCVSEYISERTRTYGELQESEHRYRSIFEAAAVSIWEEDFTGVKAAIDRLKAQGVTDFERYFEEHPEFVAQALEMVRILDVNDASVRMFRARSKKELLISLNRIFLPETRSAFAGELVMLAKGEGPFVSETVVKTLDGERMDVLFTVAFPNEEPDKSGPESFGSVLISRMDITRQKRAEEQLRQSRDQLTAILSSVVDGVTALDSKGEMIYANPAGVRLMGFSSEEEVLNTSQEAIRERFELIDESGAKLDWSDLPSSRAYNGAETDEMTVGWRSKLTGGTRWSVLKAAPVKDKDGRVEFVINFFRDITEERRADQELRRSEARFRTMADAVPVLVWTSDLTRGRTYFNKGWLEFTGRTMEQDLGYGWTEDLHPDDVEPYLALYDASFDEHKEFQIDYRLRRYDGEYRWVLSHGVPLFSPDGTFAGYIGASVDIAERVELEERKDAFIALASHELKTPITSMKLFTQLLKKRFERAGDADMVKQFSRMDMQLEKLTGLVRSLLDTSRIQAGKLEYNMEPVAIDDVVAEVAEELHNISSTHAIVMDARAGVKVLMDQDRIKQVLTNLIMNAVKFSPRAREIIVKSELDEKKREVRVSVQDFGVGIPKSEQERIFDRFYQVQKTGGAGSSEKRVDSSVQSGTFPGLGLGLYICSEIVARHGGHIWVESEEGKGSTFSFTLLL